MSSNIFFIVIVLVGIAVLISCQKTKSSNNSNSSLASRSFHVTSNFDEWDINKLKRTTYETSVEYGNKNKIIRKYVRINNYNDMDSLYLTVLQKYNNGKYDTIEKHYFLFNRLKRLSMNVLVSYKNGIPNDSIVTKLCYDSLFRLVYRKYKMEDIHYQYVISKGLDTIIYAEITDTVNKRFHVSKTYIDFVGQMYKFEYSTLSSVRRYEWDYNCLKTFYRSDTLDDKVIIYELDSTLIKTSDSTYRHFLTRKCTRILDNNSCEVYKREWLSGIRYGRDLGNLEEISTEYDKSNKMVRVKMLSTDSARNYFVKRKTDFTYKKTGQLICKSEYTLYFFRREKAERREVNKLINIYNKKGSIVKQLFYENQVLKKEIIYTEYF